MQNLIIERVAILVKIVELLKKGSIKLEEIPLADIIDYIELICNVKGLNGEAYSELSAQLIQKAILQSDYDMVVNILLILSNAFNVFAEDLMRSTTLQNMVLEKQSKLAYYQNREKVERWKETHEMNLEEPFVGKGVVYSAITGGYDNVKEPKIINPKWDYILFTDNPRLKSDIWQIRVLDNLEGLDSVRLARKIKILGHKYLSEYDYSIWIDAKLEVVGDLEQYIRAYSRGQSILCFNHYMNDCIYQEAETCKALGKDADIIIDEQMEKYKLERYPEHNGQIESGVLVRRIHDHKVISLMEIWWNEVQNYSRRDQLSFNYACWKADYVYDTSDLYIYNNEYVKLYNHNS